MTLTPNDLHRFHTKHLLSALRKSCATEEQIQQINIDRVERSLPPLSHFESKEAYYEQALVYASAFGYENYVNSEITVAQLKAELASRPHVPNKHESRKLRQNRARAGRKSGRKDR